MLLNERSDLLLLMQLKVCRRKDTGNGYRADVLSLDLLASLDDLGFVYLCRISPIALT